MRLQNELRALQTQLETIEEEKTSKEPAEDVMVALKKQVSDLDTIKASLQKRVVSLEGDKMSLEAQLKLSKQPQTGDSKLSNTTRKGLEKQVRDSERQKNESDAQKIAATFQLRQLQSQLKEEKKKMTLLEEKIKTYEEQAAT